MKKYVLKKDLPGVKKGEFVWLGSFDDGSLSVGVYSMECMDISNLIYSFPEEVTKYSDFSKFFEEVVEPDWKKWVIEKKVAFWAGFDLVYCGRYIHCRGSIGMGFTPKLWQKRMMYLYVIEQYSKKMGLTFRYASGRSILFYSDDNFDDERQAREDMASVLKSLWELGNE